MRQQVVIGIVCAMIVVYFMVFSFYSTAIIPPSTPSKLEGPIVHRKFVRESLDKSFDVLFDKYVEAHNATLAAEKAGTAKGKYLYVWTGTAGGLGNRLRPIVSGFIMALLMNRTCVIDWGSTENLYDMIDPGFELTKPTWLHFENRSMTTVVYEGGEHPIPALFENLATYYAGYDVVKLSSNNYPSILFYENPHHKDWLFEHFAYNAYTIIVRRLYKLAPRSQKIVDEFKAQQFGEYNIGIQVRYSRPVWDKLPALSIFWDAAMLLQQQNYPFHKNTTKYFLATDTQSVQGDARKALGDALTYVEPFRERYSNDSELYAFIDHVLLGECDMLVVTYTSTFGNIAVGWKSAPGIMVYHDNTYGGYPVTEPLYWDTTAVIKILQARNMTIPPLLRYQIRTVYYKK